nr:transposase [Yersinia frederiksenii]
MPLMQRLSGTHGVGPVCRELDIAPSTYYWHQQRRLHPEKCSQRETRDAQISQEIKRVYEENYSVYGARKVWRQLLREGFSVARCTVERLMKIIGLRGVLRGKVIRTTIGRKTATALDLVNRQFVTERPNQLWCADFTYVSTWQGFAYVAFIIDVFAGTIVGWQVSSSMEARFVLDALEQALWARRPSGTIHHSDKGSQYVSLAYTQRLRRRSCWRRQAAQETLTIMLWPRVSMAFTRRKSYTVRAGKITQKWSLRHWRGWTGSTIEGYLNG